ncbi:glycosyltransferase family 4 protein [Faecalibacter rhinopitheci]|uniref:Glycosyltransferase family 4 protein n=1 Tax=Faecalibacter rhinopitheci TaxID=2779678 RepID=A0A8J7FRN3_9FLAO|nr:glycosyltransferase family 4 protein [Faecalibacter rhinopitheci]MBF0598344.1 glycosyltransferase family 4 protein [Faecalibacter rhinopitheci]
MKIVFNTDQIYLHGGIEKVMATKVNYWLTLPNVEVYIVTTEQQGKEPCYTLESRVQFIDLGVNYNRRQSYFSKENIKKAFLHFKKQKSLFRKLQPDVIISPNFNFDHYWLPFIKGDSKLIKERHSSRYLEPHQRQHSSFLGKLKFKLTDWIESQYNHIVVLNKDEAYYVETNNAVVIPNPIDPTPLYAHLQNKQVMAAGRIAAVKGFDQLIEAWKIVHQHAPDWQLHIYGDNYGSTQQELEVLIKNYQLDEVIMFKGSVSNIPEVMTHYNIYALTSMTECFPTVLLEALNVGLPVVSYDCPNGPRNILTHGEDGILVQNQNPLDLANTIIYLIQSPLQLQNMSLKGKQNINRFSTSSVMQKWNNLLNL